MQNAGHVSLSQGRQQLKEERQSDESSEYGDVVGVFVRHRTAETIFL